MTIPSKLLYDSNMPTSCFKPNANEQASFQTCSLMPSRVSLLSLPEDVILLILTNLDVKAIVQLRQTSKRFHTMTKIRWVWLNALKRHVIEKGLPLPAPEADLKSLSSNHLESRTIHAAKFHENWCSNHPKPRRIIDFVPGNGEPDPVVDHERPRVATVKHVLFLPGRNGEFVVTAVGRSVICWEVPLDGSGAYRVAEWKSHGDIEQLIANEDPKHHIQLVCLTQDPMSLANRFVMFVALSLDAFHGTLIPASGLRMEREEATPMHSMRGDWMAFGNDLTVCSFFVPGKQMMSVRMLGNISDHELRSDVLKVKFLGEFLLVVRENSLQLVRYLSFDATKRSTHITTDIPSKEAAIFCRKASSSQPYQDPVTILLRTSDEGFDTIHQYDMMPNPKYCEGSEEEINRFPYILPSQYTRIISVAPSCCDLQVGSNGIGYWVQTQNVTARRSIFPARCLIGFDFTKPGQESGEDPVREKGNKLPGLVEGANEMYLCQREVYARRCDMSEIICKRYTLMSADIEDTVGRIAIGYRHGRVEVLDYV